MDKTELLNALKPIADFVRVNDSDTLGGLSRDDEEVVVIAQGSWSQAVPLTFGNFRQLAKLHSRLALPNSYE